MDINGPNRGERRKRKKASAMPGNRIGLLIRARRKEKKMSQLELGLEIGADQSTIAKIEAGSRLPTVDQIKPLATALGISLTSLVPLPDERPDTPPTHLQVAIEFVNELAFIRPVIKRTLILLLEEEWRISQTQLQKPTLIRPLAAAGDAKDIELEENQRLLREAMEDEN